MAQRETNLQARIRLTKAEQRKLRAISKQIDVPLSRMIGEAVRSVHLQPTPTNEEV